MHCPRCDAEIDKSVSFCPECGLDIDALRDEADGGSTSDETTGTGTSEAADADSATEHAGGDPSNSSQSGPSPAPEPEPAPESETGRKSGHTQEPDPASNPAAEPEPERQSESVTSADRARGEPQAGTHRRDNTGTGTTERTRAETGSNPSQQDAGRPRNQRTRAQNASGSATNQAASGHGQPQGQHTGSRVDDQASNQQSGRQRQRAPSPNQNRQANAPAPQPNQQATGFSWPTVTAAIYGAVAFAVSYGLTYALHAAELSTKTNGFTGSSENVFNAWLTSIEQHEAAAWLFYSAHTTPMEFTFSNNEPISGNVLEGVYATFKAISGNSGAGTEIQELSTSVFFGGYEAAGSSVTIGTTGEAASLLVPKLAYYAAPGVVALVAGYFLVKRVGAGRRLTDEQRVVSGALVGVAYAAIGIAAAATVFSYTHGEGANAVTIKPQLEAAAMLPFVAYPTVAAAVGGFFAR